MFQIPWMLEKLEIYLNYYKQDKHNKKKAHDDLFCKVAKTFCTRLLWCKYLISLSSSSQHLKLLKLQILISSKAAHLNTLQTVEGLAECGPLATGEI